MHYSKLLEQRNKEMMELCKSDTEEEEPENSNDTNSQPPAKGNEESTVNSTNADQEVIDDVPAVDMTKTTDEELPDLTVEIVSKDLVIEEEKSIEDILIASTEILVQKEQNVNDPVEKDDVDMKNISDHNMVTEPKSSNESQLIELHYDTEKIQNTEDVESANNSANMKLVFNDSDENVNTDFQLDTKTSSEQENTTTENANTAKENEENRTLKCFELSDDSDDFSDADINMEDLENILENAKSM